MESTFALPCLLSSRGSYLIPWGWRAGRGWRLRRKQRSAIQYPVKMQSSVRRAELETTRRQSKVRKDGLTCSPGGATISFVISRVVIAERARRQLRPAPRHIVDKLMAWIEAVEEDGLEATRRVPGFHDEPLKGKRRGQRSIRLSRKWRAIYEIRTDSGSQLVSVEEVTPHAY